MTGPRPRAVRRTAPDHVTDPGRVAIIGAGQVGTMLGLALRRGRLSAAREVALFDRDPRAAQTSLGRGAGDRILDGLEEAIDFDSIVLCPPVAAIVKLVDQLGPWLRPGTLLIDTGSAKRVVLEAMRRSVPDGVHAIGGHPMAGTERPGPDGARPDALQGATFVLTPARDDPAAEEGGRALALAAGARPIVLAGELHDRVVATTSHVPHVMAYALASMASAEGEEGRLVGGLVGRGFRGTVRLARSDPAMVAAFLSANADEVRPALDRLLGSLEVLKAALDRPDDLAALLASARRSVEAIA